MPTDVEEPEELIPMHERHHGQRHDGDDFQEAMDVMLDGRYMAMLDRVFRIQVGGNGMRQPSEKHHQQYQGIHLAKQAQQDRNPDLAHHHQMVKRFFYPTRLFYPAEAMAVPVSNPGNKPNRHDEVKQVILGQLLGYQGNPLRHSCADGGIFLILATALAFVASRLWFQLACIKETSCATCSSFSECLNFGIL